MLGTQRQDVAGGTVHPGWCVLCLQTRQLLWQGYLSMSVTSAADIDSGIHPHLQEEILHHSETG